MACRHERFGGPGSGAVRYVRRRAEGRTRSRTGRTGVRSGRSAAGAGRLGCTVPCLPAAGSAGSYRSG